MINRCNCGVLIHDGLSETMFGWVLWVTELGFPLNHRAAAQSIAFSWMSVVLMSWLILCVTSNVSLFFASETITGHTSTQICLCVTFSRCHPVEYLHSLFSQTKEPTWMPLFKTKLRWIRCLSCCAPAGLLTRPYLLTTFITACHDIAHQVNRQNIGSQMSHLSRRVTESIFSAHRFIIAPIITAVVCVGGNTILVGKSVLHQVLCLHWSGWQLGKAAAAPILTIFMSVKDNYGEW